MHTENALRDALSVKITLHKITVKENIWNSYIPSTKIG